MEFLITLLGDYAICVSLVKPSEYHRGQTHSSKLTAMKLWQACDMLVKKNPVSYFDQFSIIPRAIIQGQTGKTGKAQWNSNDAPSRCFTPLTIKSSRTGTYCLIRCQTFFAAKFPDVFNNRICLNHWPRENLFNVAYHITWKLKHIDFYDVRGGAVAEGFGAFGKKSRCPWFKSSTLPLYGFILDSHEFNFLTALCRKPTGQPPINWDSYNSLCSYHHHHHHHFI